VTRTRFTAIRRDLRRAVLRRRRPLAASFAALAVVTAVQAARPEPDTRPVVVAADDLRVGEVIAADDLETVELAANLVPAGAVDPEEPPLGRTVAGPVRSGEPLTDVRLVHSGLLDWFESGTVLTTIRVYDPAAAALVDPGDRVDVVGTDPRGRGGTEVVAAAVTVVSRPDPDDELGLGDGAPLVVAVDQATALALADAAVRRQLTVLLV
jgi:Flp pilus assembly protein CpaB